MGRDDQDETLGERERPHVAGDHNHAFPYFRRLIGELVAQPVEHCRILVRARAPARRLGRSRA
jgi:hypothetical protein